MSRRARPQRIREGERLDWKQMVQGLVCGLCVYPASGFGDPRRIPRKRILAALWQRFDWLIAIAGQWRYDPIRDCYEVVHSGCPQRRRLSVYSACALERAGLKAPPPW